MCIGYRKNLHFEYCQTKGITKPVFNRLTRGNYINGDLVFYKGNFVYDEKLVEHALKYVKEISEIINQKEFNIYFGLQVDNNFDYSYSYEKFKDGEIIKNK